MPRYKFTPGTSEQWEALDRLQVNVPENGWAMVEHLVAHAESSADMPDALRLWLTRAYKQATAPSLKKKGGDVEKQLAMLLEALGLKRGAVGQARAGVVEVGRHVHELMWNGAGREKALHAAAKSFRISKRSVRNYLKKYEDAIEAMGDK